MTANDHLVTTVMVTVVHPRDDSPDTVSSAIESWVTDRAPSAWGLGKAVQSSSVGTSSVGEDEIDWFASRGES